MLPLEGIVLEEHCHDEKRCYVSPKELKCHDYCEDWETAVVAEAVHRVDAVDNTTREHVHIRAAEHHVTMVRSAVEQSEDYGNFDRLQCEEDCWDKQQILVRNAFGKLRWSSMEEPEMPLRSCCELLPPT